MRFSIDPNPPETARSCAALVEATLPRSYAQVIPVIAYFLVSVGAFLIVPSAPFAAMALAVGGLMLTLVAFQLEAQRRARKASREDPHCHERHQLDVSPDGLRAWCEHVDTKYTWDGITRVAETKEFYVFVRGSSGGPVLPKRVIPDGQEESLRALIREHSPDRGSGLAREVVAPAT